MSKNSYALLSTFDKTGLSTLVAFLRGKGYHILSTGGTARHLSSVEISTVTQFPEILEGRVKTLHPIVYGGILAQRSKRFHLQQLEEHAINLIDFVVVNLYPFTLSFERGLSMLEAQELIDIGGVSLIRAAAKNWQDVLVITDPNDYQELIKRFDELVVDREYRLKMAIKAYELTSSYDRAIVEYLQNSSKNSLNLENLDQISEKFSKIPKNMAEAEPKSENLEQTLGISEQILKNSKNSSQNFKNFENPTNFREDSSESEKKFKNLEDFEEFQEKSDQNLEKSNQIFENSEESQNLEKSDRNLENFRESQEKSQNLKKSDQNPKNLENPGESEEKSQNLEKSGQNPENSDQKPILKIIREYQLQIPLKYGCNPHQGHAYLMTINPNQACPIQVLNGTPGYINLLDALGSWQLVRELKSSLGLPAAASFKHTSPAGAALAIPLTTTLREIYNVPKSINLDASPLATAFIRARNSDPKSSFGDFIALSDCCDEATARLIGREVSDGVIAPEYTKEALEILKKKRGGKYLVLKMDPEYEPEERGGENSSMEYREIFGLGFAQERNQAVVGPEVFENPENIPTQNQKLSLGAKQDLLLANITLKYAQSNNVVFAKDGQVIGVAAGQQSRVDCVKLGGSKVNVWYLRQHPWARDLWNLFRKDVKIKRQDKINAIIQYVEGDFTKFSKKPWDSLFAPAPPPELTSEEKSKFMATLTDVAMASDAFFPNRDNIDHASRFGVKYVMQPGGSLADKDVTQACDDYEMVMVMTGTRQFTH